MKKLECWSSSDTHTVPPQCMPDQYKKDDHDYVEAYRDFYRNDKAYFFKWTKRAKPEWILSESWKFFKLVGLVFKDIDSFFKEIERFFPLLGVTKSHEWIKDATPIWVIFSITGDPMNENF